MPIPSPIAWLRRMFRRPALVAVPADALQSVPALSAHLPPVGIDWGSFAVVIGQGEGAWIYARPTDARAWALRVLAQCDRLQGALPWGGVPVGRVVCLGSDGAAAEGRVKA